MLQRSQRISKTGLTVPQCPDALTMQPADTDPSLGTRQAGGDSSPRSVELSPSTIILVM